MESLWVTLVAVATTLFSFAASSTVLHAVAGAPGIVQLIPQNLLYTNLHPTVLLSQLQHGLRIDETLELPRSEHEQSVLPQTDGALDEARSAEESLPAPISESSKESIQNLITPEQEQLYIQLFQAQPQPSAGINDVEGTITSTGTEPTILSSAEPGPVAEAQASTAGAQELIYTKISDAPLPGSSVLPTAITLEQASILQPEPTPVSEVSLNVDQGQLQMQASLQSGGDGLKISVEDIPETGGVSTANVNLEIPTTDTRKHPKSSILTNINVNVNVNGDGKGSAVNSTSVAEITIPIKTGHK